MRILLVEDDTLLGDGVLGALNDLGLPADGVVRLDGIFPKPLLKFSIALGSSTKIHQTRSLALNNCFNYNKHKDAP